MKVDLAGRTDVVVEQTKQHEVVIRIQCGAPDKASEVFAATCSAIRAGSLVLTGVVAKEDPDAIH